MLEYLKDALLGSNKSEKNIVDLRSVFSERLGEKYSLLEKTHKHVVAAAHDNISTVKSINKTSSKPHQYYSRLTYPLNSHHFWPSFLTNGRHFLFHLLF